MGRLVTDSLATLMSFRFRESLIGAGNYEFLRLLDRRGNTFRRWGKFFAANEIRKDLNMSWTDERVDRLKKLWTDGLSASQIAAELGGVTRNAVIGKVHRLGLSGRAKGNNQTANARRKPAATKNTGYTKAPKLVGANGKTTSSAPSAPKPAPVLDIEKPKPMMLNLLQLTDSTCKFPIGDPQEEDFGFCGASPRDDDPYCEYHCRLAYQPAGERRRDRSGRPQSQLPSAAGQARAS